jgi:hypothetical protein
MKKLERNGGYLKVPEKGDPSPNPAGPGKGYLQSKTIIKKWLEAVEKAKNPLSGIEENMSQMDIITLAQLVKARKGDTVAFNSLLDRTEGKPKQTIDGNTDSKITLQIVRGKNSSE